MMMAATLHEAWHSVARLSPGTAPHVRKVDSWVALDFQIDQQGSDLRARNRKTREFVHSCRNSTGKLSFRNLVMIPNRWRLRKVVVI